MLERMLVAVVAALACAGSQAGDPCPEHPIRFAHFEFGMFYTEGKGGADEDIRQELARRSGCPFDVRVLPRARMWYELERGTVDMAASALQTSARDQFAWFAPYGVIRNYAIIGPKVPATVRSMADFMGQPELQLGGVRSYSYGPFLDQQIQSLVTQGRYYNVNEPSTLFRMFDKGRFDLIIASTLTMQHYFRALNLHPSVRVEDWDLTAPVVAGLVFSKSSFSPAQAKQWQAYITDMLRDGSMQRIFARYVGEQWAPRYLYTPPKAKSP